MGQTARKSKNALFIYTKDDSGRFWVFDGSLYHHFFVSGGKFWYVRSQAYLPAFISGSGFVMMHAERLSLQREASRHNITLVFFHTLKECEDYALREQRDQLIFDCTSPAGFFYLKKDMPRRNEDEQDG